MKEERKYQERRETRRYNSSDRESELRPSDEERRRAAAHAAPTDSPAMVSAFSIYVLSIGIRSETLTN